MLEKIFSQYRRKNPNKKISNAWYCEKAIRTLLETEKNGKLFKRTKNETISKRVGRMIHEGKIVVQEECQ
ncbi:hypothetical protein CVD27_11680 [Neobacillus cucumis]|uniref:Uncharacterized protein n=2 Tax=Neobacillus cucumis TaxID=1740721 RepID=A0A2N5HH91_9BACI|nr:hypothetical protein CVD27_11680 [Neobacillus cucumis]